MINGIYALKVLDSNGKKRTFWPLNVVLLAWALGVFLGVLIVIVALDAGVMYWRGNGHASKAVPASDLCGCPKP